MKAIIQLVLVTATLISTLIISSSAFAHSGGHGKVDKNTIIQAAQIATKTLTFKDKGMSVGKLDSSWNQVAKDKFELVEETSSQFIVKATNNQNQQTLYVKITKAGKVIDVKDASSFKNTHGHSH